MYLSYSWHVSEIHNMLRYKRPTQLHLWLIILAGVPRSTAERWQSVLTLNAINAKEKQRFHIPHSDRSRFQELDRGCLWTIVARKIGINDRKNDRDYKITTRTNIFALIIPSISLPPPLVAIISLHIWYWKDDSSSLSEIIHVEQTMSIDTME